MLTYHQLLNQLDHLRLDRVRQLLPEFLDEHAYFLSGWSP